MQIHNVQQGSPEWLELRAKHFTASEAPAMLGLSKYKTREALLREKATGIVPEVDPQTQRRFDKGHEAEAAARPIAESIVGEELFPVTATTEVDGLPLLASFDGLTMMEDVAWENKLWNIEFAEYLRETDDAPNTHWPQLEQQLLISGAEKVLFTVSDGTAENTVSIWYESRPDRRAKVIAGWKQFAEDLANYKHQPEAVKPAGRAPETLPALRIEVTGMVTASNLDAFHKHAMAVFGAINTDLQTDADFADAEKTVKWCKDVEDRLEAAKQHALSQTASIDDLFRTIDAIKAEARAKRFELDKLVKAEKENRKAEIVRNAHCELLDHVNALARRVGGPYLQVPGVSQFAEAIKGLKSIDSMREKVGNALMAAKLEASATADRIEANRKTADDMSLVPDFASICTKLPEDFAALYAHRKQQRAEAEAKRLEAERERIRQEEEAKARSEAAAKAQAEEQRIRAEERAKAQQEAQEAAVQRAEAERRLIVAAQPAPMVQPSASPLAEAKPAAVAQVAPVANDSTIKLGEICARLGFTVTAEFLTKLGFSPCGTDRAAKLYREQDFRRICVALVQHIDTVSNEHMKKAA